MSTVKIVQKANAAIRKMFTRAELLVAPAIYKIVPPSIQFSQKDIDHLVFAAPGDGNIGDQAMVSSFIENMSGNIVVIVRNAKDIHIPTSENYRVQILELKSIIYGLLRPRHLAHVSIYKGLLKQKPSVSIIGADTMDGAYNLLASVRRGNMALLAAQAGADTKILGFSLNSDPAPEAIASLRRASSAGANLMLRDPVSLHRGIRIGLSNCRESADLVFSSQEVDRVPFLANLSPGMKVALVNISAHIQDRVNQLDDYITVVRYLRERGHQVVLVPHVHRLGSSDIELTDRLEASLNDAGVYAVRELMSPAQVRGLCRQADIILTGRMHLSVIGLSQGVPAVILASQGKVEGLVARFPGHAIEVIPTVGIAAQIIQAVEVLTNDNDIHEFIDQIAHSVQLSSLNFHRSSCSRPDVRA